MMKKLTYTLVLAVFLVASKARATDFSDLWWNPSESGWGVTITQQSGTMFLTFFVYGADSKPTWFTATVVYTGQNAEGSLFYQGDLYATTGPDFTRPFDPDAVGSRKVGTATFRADTFYTGVLSYSVDGSVVNKEIQRQTLAHLNFSGDYLGAIVETDYNCANPLYNQHSAGVAKLTIQHNGDRLSMTALNLVNGASCVYQSTYAQAGRMGAIQGTFSCSNGAGGSFFAFEMEQSSAGMTARYVGQANGCQIDGKFGGLIQ